MKVKTYWVTMVEGCSSVEWSAWCTDTEAEATDVPRQAAEEWDDALECLPPIRWEGPEDDEARAAALEGMERACNAASKFHIEGNSRRMLELFRDLSTEEGKAWLAEQSNGFKAFVAYGVRGAKTADGS
jgi:hypothetical protein